MEARCNAPEPRFYRVDLLGENIRMLNRSPEWMERQYAYCDRDAAYWTVQTEDGVGTVINTAKRLPTAVSLFLAYINHWQEADLLDLEEKIGREHLAGLSQDEISNLIAASAIQEASTRLIPEHLQILTAECCRQKWYKPELLHASIQAVVKRYDSADAIELARTCQGYEDFYLQLAQGRVDNYDKNIRVRNSRAISRLERVFNGLETMHSVTGAHRAEEAIRANQELLPALRQLISDVNDGKTVAVKSPLLGLVYLIMNEYEGRYRKARPFILEDKDEGESVVTYARRGHSTMLGSLTNVANSIDNEALRQYQLIEEKLQKLAGLLTGQAPTDEMSQAFIAYSEQRALPAVVPEDAEVGVNIALKELQQESYERIRRLAGLPTTFQQILAISTALNATRGILPEGIITQMEQEIATRFPRPRLNHQLNP